MVNTTRVTMLLLAGATLWCTGCTGRLIGEGAEGVFGPKGAYWEERTLAPEKDHLALASYQRFELGQVTNEYGRHVPPKFFTELPIHYRERLTDSHLPQEPSGKTLVFNLAIIHYETADAADNIFGPLEQVVARVELVDKASGTVLAHGNAIGRTNKTVGLGEEEKAEGLAKALIKWAEDYYPEPKEKGEKEEDEPSEDSADEGQK